MSSSISDRMVDYLSNIQRREILTRERVIKTRLYLCRSIGFSICIYYILRLVILVYLMLKFLLQMIVAVILYIPQKIMGLFVSSTTSYAIIVPLFCCCSIGSFCLAKCSRKRQSLMWKFSLLLLFQSLFILLPLATSIREQRKLTLAKEETDQTMLKYPRIPLSKTKEKHPSDIEDERKINEFLKQIKATDKSNTFIPHRLRRAFQNLFSSSEEHLSSYSICSIDTAFTDLHCYDYTKSIQWNKQTYIYFLNTYRYRSPFPIYRSIIKSNGPTCDRKQVSHSSCAIQSKLNQSNDRLIRFGINISILFVICWVIYKRLRVRRPRLELSKDVLPDLPKSSTMDKTIETKLRQWFARETQLDYENLRLALNETFSSKYQWREKLNEQLIIGKETMTIERLQFTHANLHHVSQTSTENIIINAILDVEHLIFHIRNDQQLFAMKLSKLIGQLKIDFIENRIDVHLQQIEISSPEILDLNQSLSSEEKESILQLLKDLINQTVVQCHFHLTDKQEKTLQPIILLPSIFTPPSPVNQQCETPIIRPIEMTPQSPLYPIKEVKKLLIRIVKAVQLHDVEQPYCILELNHPKQIQQTSLAKNGLNPFWDERFLFECNEQTNRIRLQIIDRKKPANKKHSTNLIETTYADVCIPFAYVTSTSYKQDVRITPQYPESIIRIEFSTITEEEISTTINGDSRPNSPNWSDATGESNENEHGHRRSPSDEILALTCHDSSKNRTYQNDAGIYPRSPSHQLSTDRFATISPMDSIDGDTSLTKSRKSRSFMRSFRIFSRRKNYEKKNKHHENGFTSPVNTPAETDVISHSITTEPILSPNPSAFSRHQSTSRSFRNFFKRKPTHPNNFIVDQPDLQSVTTPPPKKRSFFRRFRTKPKRSIQFSTNSLTSEDCTRSESVRNTPIRANVGHPVTMT